MYDEKRRKYSLRLHGAPQTEVRFHKFEKQTLTNDTVLDVKRKWNRKEMGEYEFQFEETGSSVSQEFREETVCRIPNTKKWKLLKGMWMLFSQDTSNS